MGACVWSRRRSHNTGRDGHDAALRSSADEADPIKSSPNAILAEGIDCRFLNELKRELKA
jgi:hypothetical protein